jgi:hypothetical protein
VLQASLAVPESARLVHLLFADLLHTGQWRNYEVKELTLTFFLDLVLLLDL